MSLKVEGASRTTRDSSRKVERPLRWCLGYVKVGQTKEQAGIKHAEPLTVTDGRAPPTVGRGTANRTSLSHVGSAALDHSSEHCRFSPSTRRLVGSSALEALNTYGVHLLANVPPKVESMSLAIANQVDETRIGLGFSSLIRAATCVQIAAFVLCADLLVDFWKKDRLVSRLKMHYGALCACYNAIWLQRDQLCDTIVKHEGNPDIWPQPVRVDNRRFNDEMYLRDRGRDYDQVVRNQREANQYRKPPSSSLSNVVYPPSSPSLAGKGKLEQCRMSMKNRYRADICARSESLQAKKSAHPHMSVKKIDALGAVASNSLKDLQLVCAPSRSSRLYRDPNGQHVLRAKLLHPIDTSVRRPFGDRLV